MSLATNAREGERLECLGRDRQYPESYRFILLDAEAQRGTRILRFGGGAAPVADAAEPSPAGRRLLDRPNGVKYHRLHIDLLRRLAARPELRDTAWREVFRARAERFASYLKEGSPRDARPKAPRVRYARTDEIVLRDLSGAGWSAGNEPARLVDGDGDSVLILRPEELERTFAVTFTRPVALHGVGVDFYAAPFAPAGLAVDAGSVETFAFRESRPERFWMNLDPAPTTARAAFRFSGASEKGPVIVRELRFLVDPDRPALESLAAALPPLPRDRRPAWDELLVLEAALRGRFPLGRPAGGSIRETIDSGVAQCADRVALLGGLLDLHGIPWRPINFHNSPNIGDGHTALEIWHDGGWRYLDPSFGFWVPGPAGPLSFSDLSANPDRAAEGRPAPGAPDMKGIDTPDFFRRAEPAGPAGPLDPMLFPVSVGTAGVALGSYGPTAGPGSCRDLDSVVAPGIPAGLAYVGQSLEHRALVFRFPASDTATWRVTLVPAYRTDGKFELELSAEGGRLIGPASWRPAFVGFRTDEAQIMSLRFVQQLPGATLTVGFTPGRYPSYMELDAIRVERVVE